ncbi:MAG: tetratricopeptide repeat protein [Phycisphaeraceae bacterium]|nr:tetratricopeptide repeat protein [Phycisphaeraceae bacterium]
MAAKVNKTFVLVLVAVLVIIAGGVVAVALVLKGRGGSEEIGDQYRAQRIALTEQIEEKRQRLQEGESDATLRAEIDDLLEQSSALSEMAIRQYRAAFGRNRTNIGILTKVFEETSARIVTERLDARNEMMQLRGILEQAQQLRPDDPEWFRKRFEFDMKLAHMGNRNLWGEIVGGCTEQLRSYPGFFDAHRIRGIALAHHMAAGFVLQDAQRRMLESDLKLALDADEDDLAARHALAMFYAAEVNRLRDQAAMQEAVQTYRAEALRLIDLTLDSPESRPHHRLDMGLVLHQLGEHDRFIELVHECTSEMKRQPESMRHVRHLARILLRVPAREGGPPSGEVARDLLRSAMRAMPNDARLALELAELEVRQQRFDEAIPLLQRLYGASIRMTPLDAVSAFAVRDEAGIRLVDAMTSILIDNAQLDESTRREYLADSERIVGELLETLGDREPVLNYVRGKLAFHRAEYRQALSLMRPMVERYRAAGDVPQYLQSSRLVGIAAQRLGETGEAIARFRSIAQVAPEHRPVRDGLIRMLLNARQWEEARELVDAALQTDSDNAELRGFNALLLSAEGREEEALREFAAVDLTAVSDPVRRQLAVSHANALSSAGRLEPALTVLENHLRTDPTDFAAINAFITMGGEQHRERAERLLSMAEQAGADVDHLATVRRVLFEGQREQVTAETLERLRLEEPVQYHMLMYRLASARGQLEEASAQLRQAAEARQNGQQGRDMPEVIGARFDHALRTGDFSLAEQLLDRVRERNVDGAQGLFFDAQLRLAQGRADVALQRVEAGLARVGVSSSGQLLRGRILLDLGRPADAISALRLAVEARPDNLEARMALAEVHERRGELPAAISELEAALRLAQNDEGLQNQYVRLLVRAGRLDRALELRRRIAETSPDNFRNQVGLAELLLRGGQEAEALVIARRLADAQPEDLERIEFLAHVMSRSDQADEALNLLARTIEAREGADRMRAQIALARLQRSLGRVDQARQTLVGALGQDDEARTIRRELARVLAADNRHEDASRILAELIEAFPSDGGLHLARLDSLVALGLTDQALAQIRAMESNLGSASLSALRPEILNRRVQIAAIQSGERRSAAGRYRAQGRAQDAQKAQAEAGEHLRRAAALVTELVEMPGLTTERRAAGLYQRARLRAAQERISDAIGDLRQALGSVPEYNDARFFLIQLLMSQNDESGAIAQIREVLDRDHGNAQARRTLAAIKFRQLPGSLRDLRLLLDESRRMFPLDDFWPGMQGRLEFSQEQYDRARRRFEEQLALRVTPDAVFELGRTHLRLGRPQAVLDLLRDHPTILSENPQVRALQARAFLALDRTEQSARAFELAMNTASSNPAMLQSVISQIEEELPRASAIQLLSSWSASRQDRAGMVARRAVTRLLMLDRRFDEALAVLNQMAREIEDDAPGAIDLLLLPLARVYDELGKPAEAVAVYDRVLAVNPDAALALNNSAFLLANKLQKPEQAVERARRAVELNGRSAHMLDTLGWSLFKLAQARDDDRALLDEAVDTLNRSVAVQEIPYNCLHLAKVLHHRGDQARARIWADRARQIAERNPETYAELLAEATEFRRQLTQPAP